MIKTEDSHQTVSWRSLMFTDSGSSTRGKWGFVGGDALPTDPVARSHEKRGRRWLMASYILCPCHLPLTISVLGAVFGGTAFGAALSGSSWLIGGVMAIAFGLVLWRGFRSILMAKRIQVAGGRVTCTPRGCVPASS